MKREKYELISGPAGSIVPHPIDDREETDPAPEEVWALHERGIGSQCRRCGAPLRIGRSYIFCPTDRRHFDVIV